MIDLELLRDDPELVRGEDPALVDALLEANAARRGGASRIAAGLAAAERAGEGGRGGGTAGGRRRARRRPPRPLQRGAGGAPAGGEDDLYLVGTSAVPMAGYHSGEIVDFSAGPRRYAGWSSCFRREAGSYGKDTRAARKFECEAWVPTQNAYRELTSTSNCTTFQARRLNVRYRDEHGKTQVAATLNGTLATTRWIVAILENHQPGRLGVGAGGAGALRRDGRAAPRMRDQPQPVGPVCIPARRTRRGRADDSLSNTARAEVAE